MAMIKKDGNFMGLPVNIARGNPIPLDKSEIWYSYDEMIAYAATDPTAYVGQILGLVNEQDNIATAYIILNINGDVREVGKATVVDDATIILKEETLSLKDFGKRFYKYVPEDNGVAAHYVLQEVDEQNPWFAGLEPKVVQENGKFVLGWYQPNPTTMEGVNTQIGGIQTAITDLNTTTTNLSNRLDNVYTKEETDTEIAQKVAAAAHLKRKKVGSINDIDTNAADAEQYIYMVPTGLQEDDNKYDEYIVIDGIIEPVGSWEVDLSDYATTSYVDNNFIKTNPLKDLVEIEQIQKLLTVSANAEPNVINSVDSNFAITDKTLELISIPISIDLSSNISLLNNFVKKQNDKDLVSNSEIAKLFTVAENAEKNIINSVSSEFAVSDDSERKLSLTTVDGAKIINLTNNTDFNQVKIDLITISNDVGNISSTLDSINASLVTIGNKFGNYVLQSDYDDDMRDVWNCLTWHEL